MNAILLAAGVGQRLSPLTDTTPKCLLPMGTTHLLGRTLDALSSCGVERTTIVVGHCAAQIVRAAGDRWQSMPIRFVSNADFAEGSVVSLWCARTELDADVLIMDADVLFPRVLLARLVRSPHASCSLLDGRTAGSGEEMILFAAQQRVWDIVRRRPNAVPSLPAGVTAFDTKGESVGFLKLGAADANILRAIVERHVARGLRHIDHELTYPDLFTRCPVGYERVDDLPWTEIDFACDLTRAREEILPRVEKMDRDFPPSQSEVRP